MSWRWLAIALVALLQFAQPAAAQDFATAPAAPDAGEEARAQEFRAAFTEGLKAATKGKADVQLISQATLHLPAGYLFIPQAQGERIMRALGNTTGMSFKGLIFPMGAPQTWFIAVQYIESGYIKDDEAKDWKADDLLANLREGTEEGNKDRIARGFEPIEVVGWAEPPTYDATTHRLVWAATNREKNVQDSQLGVNYNTYALGREGYFSLNLLTDADKLGEHKVHSRTLLAALEYNKGKAYNDFDASSDHVAAYGITALVAGVAAKKLGLFALFAAFLAKGAKLIVVGVVAIGVAIKQFFTGKKPPEA